MGEGAAAEQARRHLPCALLLLRATEARTRQLPLRACLVTALMYDRRLSADVLRLIDAAVAPPPVAAYPSPSGLLPAGTPVILGALGKAELNGASGTLLGTDSSSGRYMVKVFRGASIKVRPENVLPQKRQVEASGSRQAGGEEEADDGEDEDDW